MSNGWIQKQDIKTLADLIAAGAAGDSLPQDTQIWVSANGLATTLDQFIALAKAGDGDSPLRMFATVAAPDNLLHINSSQVTVFDGGAKTTGPFNDFIAVFPATTIDFQTAAVVGGTVTLHGGGAFALPATTLGQYRRLVFTFDPVGGTAIAQFSPAVASYGSLANAGTLFGVMSGIPFGYVDLQATVSGFRTASSAGNSAGTLIENGVSSAPAIWRVFGISSGATVVATGATPFKISQIVANVATIKAGVIYLEDGREVTTYDGATYDGDITVNLKTQVNTGGVVAPAASTTYYLYLDQTALPGSSATLSNGRVVFGAQQGTSGPFVVLAGAPNSGTVDLARYVPIAAIATDGSSNYVYDAKEDLNDRVGQDLSPLVDGAFKALSVISNVVMLKGGFLLDDLGREIATNGATLGADQSFNLKTGVNTAGIIAPGSSQSGYYLYLDLTQLGSVQVLTPSGRSAYPVASGTSGAYVVLQSPPTAVNLFRYVPVACFATDGSGNYVYNNQDDLAVRRHAPPVTGDAKLVRGGTWSWNSGTGVLSWTAAAAIQVPGLAESVNNIVAGNVTLSPDGVCAFVNVNRTGAGGNLTVGNAAISALQPNGTLVVVARRIGTAVVLHDGTRLLNGESKALGQGLSDQNNTYLGSADEATSSPAYTTANGPSTPNSYIADGDNVTKAVKELDTRAGVVATYVAQDRSAELVDGGNWAWNSGTGVLSWSAQANVAVPGLADSVNSITAGNATLTDGQAAYVTLNRAGPGGALTPTVVAQASVPVNDNVLVLARRSGAVLYLARAMRLLNGETKTLYSSLSAQNASFIGATSEADASPAYSTAAPGTNAFIADGDSLAKTAKLLDQRALAQKGISAQDRSTKLINGGTWAWNGGTGVISWSGVANLAIPGLADSVNNIVAGSATLTDGQVAYVEVNRTGPGGNLTVSVSAESALTPTDNTVILCRRVGATLYLGVRGDFFLVNGESTILDSELSDQTKTLLGVTDSQSSPAWNTALGAPLRTIPLDSTSVLSAVASIDTQVDKFFGQFRLTNISATRMGLTGADVTMQDGSVRVQTINNLLINSTGAQIAFQGANVGNVYAADGTTLIGTFTFTLPAVNQFRWYQVSLIQGAIGSDNRVVPIWSVTAATADGASAAAAPRASFTDGALPIGQFVVQNLAGVATFALVDQLGSGAGGGGGSDKTYSITTITAAGTLAADTFSLKGGYMLLDDGREVGSGSGTTSATVGVDLTVSPLTILTASGLVFAANTAYYLYVDLFSLATTPVTLTDNGRQVYTFGESNLRFLTTPPSAVNPYRYVYIDEVHSAAASTDFLNALTAARPTKLHSLMAGVFTNPFQTSIVTATTTGTQTIAHSLGRKPQLVTAIYDDGAGTAYPVDAYSLVTNMTSTQITFGTDSLALTGLQSLTFNLYAQSGALLVAPTTQFVSQFFTAAGASTLAHGLGSKENIRGVVVQIWDVALNQYYLMDLPRSLVTGWDDTLLYLDWTGMSPAVSATFQYRIITGISANPYAVPLELGGYTKFVGRGLNSYSTVAAALAASVAGDSILVMRGYTIASGQEETWALSGVRVDFMPQAILTYTGTGTAVTITANDFSSNLLYVSIITAGTVAGGIAVSGNDVCLSKAQVEAWNAGLTLTAAYKVNSGSLRAEVKGGLKNTLSTAITSKLVNNGTDTDATVRG